MADNNRARLPRGRASFFTVHSIFFRWLIAHGRPLSDSVISSARDSRLTRNELAPSFIYRASRVTRILRRAHRLARDTALFVAWDEIKSRTSCIYINCSPPKARGLWQRGRNNQVLSDNKRHECKDFNSLIFHPGHTFNLATFPEYRSFAFY